MGLRIGIGINIGNKRNSAYWVNFWLTATPSNLTLEVLSDTSIRVNFDNPGTVDGHSIVFSTDNVTFTEAATATGAERTKDITGLTAGTLYYAKVRARKGTRYSEYTSVVSVTTWTWYGYELDEANTSPDVTRIAGTNGMTHHASLPVQSLIKGCILNDDGTVNYYLKPTDWSKKLDDTASVLDGTDGQVMVEIPRFYHKIDNPSDGVYQHKISLYPITRFIEIPKFYYAAYEAALNRTTSKLASVKNLTTTYRGGYNNAAWDAADNTLLGKPATNISLTNYRTYARNRNADTKWNVSTWRQDMLLYDLFIIEYATRNSQKAVNAYLTVDGYKQGGLGVGVTEFWDWATYNSYNPLIPCGQSDTLGNASGEISYAVPGTAVTVKIPRYRGVENLYGHIWKWCDGASVYHQTVGEGDLSKFYTCDNPANFADGTASNYDYRCNLPRSSGYLKNVTHDAKGIIVPSLVGADSVTNFCDYLYTPGGVGYWVALVRGGDANAGAGAGFVYLITTSAASYAAANVGARLCYIP